MATACGDDPLWSTSEVGRYLNLPKRQARALIASGTFGSIDRNASGHFLVSSAQVMGYQPDRQALRERFRDRRAISESELFWLYDLDTYSSL